MSNGVINWCEVREDTLEKTYHCTSCDGEIHEEFHFCPYCGRRIKWWLIEQREAEKEE